MRHKLPPHWGQVRSPTSCLTCSSYPLGEWKERQLAIRAALSAGMFLRRSRSIEKQASTARSSPRLGASKLPLMIGEILKEVMPQWAKNLVPQALKDKILGTTHIDLRRLQSLDYLRSLMLRYQVKDLVKEDPKRF